MLGRKNMFVIGVRHPSSSLRQHSERNEIQADREWSAHTFTVGGTATQWKWNMGKKEKLIIRTTHANRLVCLG